MLLYYLFIGTERLSLNYESRKRDLIKIARENQAIFKRLQKKQPSYRVMQFHKQYHCNLKFMRNICSYPLILSKNKSGSIVFYII